MKAKKRRMTLQEIQNELMFFKPHQLNQLLRRLIKSLGNRRINFKAVSTKSVRTWRYRRKMCLVAIDSLGSVAAAKAWVREPAFALVGRVPWRVCVSKKGLQECVVALRRIDYNIAS